MSGQTWEQLLDQIEAMRQRAERAEAEAHEWLKAANDCLDGNAVDLKERAERAEAAWERAEAERDNAWARWSEERKARERAEAVLREIAEAGPLVTTRDLIPKARAYFIDRESLADTAAEMHEEGPPLD